MIRERVPLEQFGVTEERVQSLFRFWFCCYCGLDFTLKAQSRPVMCPLCLTPYEETQPAFARLERFLQYLSGIFRRK